MVIKRKIAFLILPNVHLLDLSGAVQVFFESATYGKPYEIVFCSIAQEQYSSAGLKLADLVHFSKLNIQKNDYLFIPGIKQSSINETLFLKLEQANFFQWLNDLAQQKVIICSVCNGAFILGKAGLLNNRKCTTHWKVIDALASNFPKAKVQDDCIFAKDAGIYTSAGITSGIDMALSILEENHGTPYTAKISRELVVYIRRNGLQSQKSVYLDYRNHVHAGIHRVQDWLIDNITHKKGIEDLAVLANMSSRNLTRIFRRVTGISINDFRRMLRLEKAKQLLEQTNLTIEHIAQQCGYDNPRQFRRIWQATKGELPSVTRKKLTTKTKNYVSD